MHYLNRFVLTFTLILLCDVCLLTSVRAASLSADETQPTEAPVADAPITNKTVIEPVHCTKDEDCQEFHIDSELTNKVICNVIHNMCVIALVEEDKPIDGESNASTKGPKRTTAQPEEGDDEVTTIDEEIVDTTLSTTTTTTTAQVIHIESEFNSIPVVVWVLFTIPFISIIILGIICGRRLKMQSDNIQENLLRTTINGVHVDQLLSQRENATTAAISRPPPTYEKATGEIPPSYETVLQGLSEKRKSIFQCDSLMCANSNKDHQCDTRSYCSACSSSIRSLSSTITNYNQPRRAILFTISRNNLGVPTWGPPQ